MGMSTGAGGGKNPTPVMNVTPLVDVVLVLLIIFMVVTPMLSKQFWLNLPKKDEKAEETPPPQENKNIVVLVTKAGEVKVNSEVIPTGELKDRLARMLAARSDKVIFFDAEDDAPYVTAVQAMDLSRQGGASTIAILTDKLVK